MTQTLMPLRGALLALVSFCAYAVCDVMLKFMGQDMGAFQVMLLAAAYALPFLFGQILLTEGLSLRPNLPGWTVIRVSITVLNVGLVTYTITVLPLAQCYAIFFTMPLMITVLAWPLLGERLDLLRGAMVTLGFAGVLIALQPRTMELELGHLTAVCAAILGALNSLILRKTSGREKRGVMLLYPLLGQLILSICLLATYDWQPVPPRAYVAATVLGVMSTVGGLLIVTAYRIAPTVAVAPMQYSQIIWASMLAYVLFLEIPSLEVLTGIAVIAVAGTLQLAFAGRRQKVLETA